ncbi:MAG: MOSC domain-containing protein [Rhizobiaceae bacterium]
MALSDALLCVTQPTERCRTIGRNLGKLKILKAMHRLEIYGCYSSIIEPGLVSTGCPIMLKYGE